MGNVNPHYHVWVYLREEHRTSMVLSPLCYNDRMEALQELGFRTGEIRQVRHFEPCWVEEGDAPINLPPPLPMPAVRP